MSSAPQRPDLPATARDTTAEQPWPVRTLSLKIGDYVAKMSPLWVEGQLVQVNRRPGMRYAYLTLRDTDVDMSLPVSIPVPALEAMGTAPEPGSRVVVHAKPTFWTTRGTLQLEARQIRHVGVGELLARLEQLKTVLRGEGLFDSDRKRPLPFLPRRIGVVCGRNTAAERDVIAGVQRRWPAARLEIRQVPVQGPDTVTAVSGALAELDAVADVEVIIITRGGGSFEDLLPFSNEALIRSVAACSTPVVSAIGHESDTPLLDLVADLRASTPTHAASAMVPDVADELRGLSTVRSRARRAMSRRVQHERQRLGELLSRPVMATRAAIIAAHRAEIDRLGSHGRQALTRTVTQQVATVQHLHQHLRAVSPQHTLQRGYAVVRDSDGHVLRDTAEVGVDQVLRVTLARGDFAARALGDSPQPRHSD